MSNGTILVSAEADYTLYYIVAAMPRVFLKRNLPRLLQGGVIGIIVLMPFHAFLTVWLAQLLGHYTFLRLWKEGLLALLVIGAVIELVVNPELCKRIQGAVLTRLIVGFVALQGLLGAIAYATHAVTLKALGYGLIVDSRLLIFFLVAWVAFAATQSNYPQLLRIVWIPASFVLVIGLLQYFVLPHDVLTHFGYNAHTIFPYEDINHNMRYIRVMATLRGANPLGVYLVMLIGLGIGWFAWQRTHKTATVIQGSAMRALFLASIIVLFLTFSRGAWIGALACLLFIVATHLAVPRLRKAVTIGLIGIVVCMGLVTALLWHNTTFQNIIWHTQDDSLVTTTSNVGHLSALKAGMHDALHEPFGRGPGTAGPASAYNTGHDLRIAEDFFIQLAQEVGWLGLALFVAIMVVLGCDLWAARRTHPWALGLLVGLVGITVANLFSHAWADDTLAYLWWGLAGIAYARMSEPAHSLTDSSNKR